MKLKRRHLKVCSCFHESPSGTYHDSVVDEGLCLELSQEERECIDKMSNEQICDFLREKHMSNKHPPSTK